MSVSPRVGSTKVVRKDIQALRTVAVSLVVLFHLWPNRLSGGFVGVDIFFVISGFLITKHILNEVERGHFSVTAFWSRRIKRLLPASFTVLAVTALLVVLLAPISQWPQWLGEIQAAVFYFENWKLAWSAVDYLALANQVSPVQHFWSLSTEEQFYFVWPILVALGIFFATRFARTSVKPRLVVLVVFTAVTISSLVFSIIYTSIDPAVAYFSTPVRAWEFGLGALAVFVPVLRSNRLKVLLVGLGAGLMLWSAIAINNTTPFPGAAALLPVLATGFVIVAALDSGWLARAFSIRPIQWVGDKSYAIYLWHWPALIFTPLVLHRAPNFGDKVAIIFITIFLAWLTHKFIELPMQAIKPPEWKVFAVAATASVFIASLCGLALQLGNQQIADQLKFGKSGEISAEDCFGAAAREVTNEACINDGLTGLYPSLAVAASDLPDLPESCFSVSREQVEASFCELGDRSSKVKIAAVGDSHIAQYAGALNALAVRNNWAIDMYSKGGCPFTYAVRKHDAVLTKNCPLWVSNVLKKLMASDYTLMVTSQRAGVAWVGGNDSAVVGLTKIWQELSSAGLPILALKDSPQPDQKMPACLISGKDCLLPTESALGFDAQVRSAAAVPSVRLVDFDYIFCDAKNCLPVIGHVVVYRDDNHITDTFARSLAPFIEVEIKKLLKN